MLHETDDVVLLGELDEIVVVVQELYGGFGDQDVDAAFDCVFRDGVVRA